MPAHEQILELQKRMGQSIICQEDVVERVLLGLLSNVLSRQPLGQTGRRTECPDALVGSNTNKCPGCKAGPISQSIFGCQGNKRSRSTDSSHWPTGSRALAGQGFDKSNN
jgi:hypothetical protein